MKKLLALSRANTRADSGFTLPEIIVTVGIITVLFGIGTVSLLRVQRRPLQEAAVSTLVVDSKNQQTKAMAGDTEGSGSTNNYGVFFDTSSYTLFRGSVYSPSDPANFVVDLESSLRFININFVSSTLAFSMGSGNVVNYSLGSDSVSIENINSGDIITITLNQYGAVDIN